MTKEEFANLWLMYYRGSLLDRDDLRDMRQKFLDFLNTRYLWPNLGPDED